MDIAICEDVPQHADYLANLIETYYVGREQPIFHKYDRCGRFLHEFLNRKINYDVIFLDIIMPGINGLEAAKQIRFSDESVPIVFITSALEHAQEGYEYDAVSFLSKPVGMDKLFQTLDRIEKRRKASNTPFLLIASEGYVFRVLLSSIISVQRVGRKTAIYRTDGKIIYSNQSIGELVSVIKASPNFAVTYQTDYVNLRYIIDVDKKRRIAVLADGRTILIGRNRLQPFLETMTDYLGEAE